MLATTEVQFADGVPDVCGSPQRRVRQNTVRCDFAHLPRDLCVLEMHDFVDNYLRVAPADLELLQWNGHQRCLFLRLRDLPTAQRLIAAHSGRHSYPPGRLGMPVLLTLEDAPTEVLLYDLSELVTDDEIMDALDRYGVVVDIGHNRWQRGLRYSGIASGHRLVQMVIRRRIPQVIFIANEPAFVVYIGQETEQLAAPHWLGRAFGRVANFMRRVLLPCRG